MVEEKKVDKLVEKAEEITKARSEEEPAAEIKADSGLIDKASAAAKRLEEANAKQEELLNRQEELAAKQQLAGRANAGETVQQKTQEEKDQEAADKIINQFAP